MHRQMDLIGTYSNHRNRADLLKRTRRWLSEGRQASSQDPKVSARARPEGIVLRRVVDRLGEEAVRELVEARRAGATRTNHCVSGARSTVHCQSNGEPGS